MSKFTDDVATLCLEEYRRWDNGAGKETDDQHYRIVGEYWSYGLKNAHIDGRTTYENSKAVPYRPAWSAAFVSYILRKGGAGAEFLYHEGHIHYVMKAIRDADAGSTNAKFMGRDPRTYAPKIGDLINAGRGSAAKVTYDTVRRAYGDKIVPKGNFLPSHTDIVVEASGRSLSTIGGNVSDSVGKKTWALKPDGTLVKGPTLICVIEDLL